MFQACYFHYCKIDLSLYKIWQIKLSFLPVGHTHEDVDQMFSRFSLYLEKHDAVTPQELVTAIEASYTPTPKVHEIKETYNIKDLFQPYLRNWDWRN